MLTRVALLAAALVSNVFGDAERQVSSDHSVVSTPVDERAERLARERELAQILRRYQRLIDAIGVPLFDIRSAILLDEVPSPDDASIHAFRATLAEVAPQFRNYSAAFVARYFAPEVEFMSVWKESIAVMITDIVTYNHRISAQVKTLALDALDLLLGEFAKSLPEQEVAPLRQAIATARALRGDHLLIPIDVQSISRLRC